MIFGCFEPPHGAARGASPLATELRCVLARNLTIMLWLWIRRHPLSSFSYRRAKRLVHVQPPAVAWSYPPGHGPNQGGQTGAGPARVELDFPDR